MRNPYSKIFERMTRPRWPTHSLELLVEIKKGETSGRVEIPAHISLTQHTIDFNPSLLKKSTNQVKGLPLNQRFSFHPDDEALLVENGERIKHYETIEPCPHCGQKFVIAEVGESRRLPSISSRFNIDPVIEVKMSAPVSEDIAIPVKVGLFLNEIKLAFQHALLILLMMILVTSTVPIALLSGDSAAIRVLLSNAPLIAGILAVMWLFYVPYTLWNSLGKYRWYLSIKDKLVPVE